VGTWLIGLVTLAGLMASLGADFSDATELPNSESATAYRLMDQGRSGAPAAEDLQSGTIVWHTENGLRIRDARVRADVSAALTRIGDLPGVESVISPYESAGRSQLNTAANTAFATVTIGKDTDPAPILAVADRLERAGLQVEAGGQAFTEQPAAGGPAEGLGVLVALLLLLLVFRSVPAALLPIVTGVAGVGASTLVVMLASHVITLSSTVITMGTLIGLGVGIDYALFIVNRHRKALMAGADVSAAIALAVNTSGRAVVFAGATVIVALLGMSVMGLSVLTGMAVSAAVTVLFTVLSAITLLPALLRALKLRVLSRRQRRQRSGTAPDDVAPAGRPARAARWAELVQNHPIPSAVAALVVLAVLAFPALSMRLGNADASSDPADSPGHAYFTTMSEGFGDGVDATLLLVAQTPDAAAAEAFTALVKDIATAVPNVAAASLNPGQSGNPITIATLTPTRSAQTEETADLVTDLRDRVIPPATAGTDLKVYVGGATASDIDLSNALLHKLPTYLILVTLLGFLLLVLAFRSLLVPLLGAVSNLATICVGLGVTTAIFQFGWGTGLLGVGTGAPIQDLTPVLLCGVVFGLSMDYQVFLVSRMHEEWSHFGDNRRAVRVGITETAGVVIAAATIMLAVFASFGFSGQRIVAAIGMGMAISVVVDAFVVRLILVPALMTLIGRANWYYPRTLGAITPHLSLESSAAPVTALPVPVPAPAYRGAGGFTQIERADADHALEQTTEGTWKQR
jgi:RND superfamily putative drug exporter